MSKKINKKNDSNKNNNDNIVKDVVAELKPQLDTFLQDMRSDILADVSEQIQRLKINTPNVANSSSPVPGGAVPATSPSNNVDLSSIMKSLTEGGQVDMAKISQMMNSVPSTASQIPMAEIGKLNENQIKYLQNQQMMEMFTKFLPALITQQQSSNPMMQEMMTRIFLEKINSSLFMDKIMIQKMAQGMNAAISMPETGLTAGIPQASVGPVGALPGAVKTG